MSHRSMFGMYIPTNPTPPQWEDRSALSATEQSNNWGVRHSDKEIDEASRRRQTQQVFLVDIKMFQIRYGQRKC